MKLLDFQPSLGYFSSIRIYRLILASRVPNSVDYINISLKEFFFQFLDGVYDHQQDDSAVVP